MLTLETAVVAPPGGQQQRHVHSVWSHQAVHEPMKCCDAVRLMHPCQVLYKRMALRVLCTFVQLFTEEARVQCSADR